MFFGISTSSGIPSVSIFDKNFCHIKTIYGEQDSQSKVLPSLAEQALSGFDKNNIICIFVDIGPGSFTGVRTGISFGIGLAALGSQISGISALEAVGFNTGKQHIYFKNIRDTYYYQDCKFGLDPQVIHKDDLSKITNLDKDYQIDSRMICEYGINLFKKGIIGNLMPIYLQEPMVKAIY